MYFEIYDKLKEYILRNPEGLEGVMKEEIEKMELTQEEENIYDSTYGD